MNEKEIENRRIFDLCHDFRTPLNTIMGMTTMTWTELEDREKVKNRLATIETASNYLLSMVNELLDYSIIINGKINIRNENFNLGRIIDLLTQLHLPGFKKKKQSFEIRCTNIISEEIIGDFLRISQILTNLLTNSMKYTGVGGKIIMEFSQIQEFENSLILVMEVTDNGIGMSEDFLKKMFEPYSIESEDDIEQSTGLGLYITKNLVSMMDGEIVVTSILKKGTIFTVKIPCGIP